jgi:hypothetical protein
LKGAKARIQSQELGKLFSLSAWVRLVLKLPLLPFNRRRDGIHAPAACHDRVPEFTDHFHLDWSRLLAVIRSGGIV